MAIPCKSFDVRAGFWVLPVNSTVFGFSAVVLCVYNLLMVLGVLRNWVLLP